MASFFHSESFAFHVWCYIKCRYNIFLLRTDGSIHIEQAGSGGLSGCFISHTGDIYVDLSFCTENVHSCWKSDYSSGILNGSFVAKPIILVD